MHVPFRTRWLSAWRASFVLWLGCASACAHSPRHEPAVVRKEGRASSALAFPKKSEHKAASRATGRNDDARAAGAHAVETEPNVPPSITKPLRVFGGRASYYADSLAGRPTASGEPYNVHKFTAAHRTLPLGTLLRVVCPDTQRSVVVLVNDRGPFGAKGRVIDLSRAAAQKLGLLRRGVARVRVEVLQLGPKRPVRKKKKR